MKTMISLTLAALAGFIAAYFVVSSQKESAFSRERQALLLELEAARSGARVPVSTAAAAQGETVRIVRSSAPATASAPEVLEKLKALRVPAGPERARAIRQVIHQLETLADLGPAALPVIREFLAKFEDVDYAPELNREGDNDDSSSRRAERSTRWTGVRSAQPGASRSARLDFITPPSLRLGLVDVLREIGGEGAEQILAEMLSTSGRAVEVAYAARALQELAPDKYRETALSAAKDLLANPPAIERPSPLDENAQAYLYAILDLHGDAAAATNVQGLLVTAAGQIDRAALNYLTTTLKEQAVPSLYQAYKDPRVTNFSEKTPLVAQIISYAGASQAADDAVREIVFDESTPAWMRALSVQSLAGGRGPFASAMPTDEAQLRARIHLLNNMGQFSDETLARARAEALERLSNRLATVTDPGGIRPTFRSRGNAGGTADDAPPLP